MLEDVKWCPNCHQKIASHLLTWQPTEDEVGEAQCPYCKQWNDGMEWEMERRRAEEGPQ